MEHGGNAFLNICADKQVNDLLRLKNLHANYIYLCLARDKQSAEGSGKLAKAVFGNNDEIVT
jgi:hypothetical protein